MNIENLISPVVIEYGRADGNDVDRMVILPGGKIADPYLPSRPIDECQCEMYDFIKLIEDRHPQVTEPILTGKIISGDVEWFNSVQAILGNQPVPAFAERALMNWAIWNVDTARAFMKDLMSTGDIRYLVMALGNTTYAVSCVMFAMYYRRDPSRTVNLQEALSGPNGLSETALVQFRHGREQFELAREKFKSAQKLLFEKHDTSTEIQNEEWIARARLVAIDAEQVITYAYDLVCREVQWKRY